jgi:hypothetical protein
MIRSFITIPAAVLVSTAFLFAAAGPAAAATDPRCTTMPEQVRVAVPNADASTARQALRYLSIGEKLCEAGNEHDATKKFEAALRTLGVENREQLAEAKR